MTFPTEPQAPSGVQPGGGWCMRLETFWGKIRRAWLRRFRPGYVRRMLDVRQGSCPVHFNDVIDPRDLKFIRNVCGYWFRPEDDRFAWRGRLGFARHGLGEMVVFTLLFLLLGGAAATAAVLVHWAFWIPVGALGLVWLEILWFFRDPHRTIPPEADVLVSPADGTITHIEETEEPEFSGKCLRISIFLSIFNVHVNRSPRAARVTQVRYFPGAYLDARNPDSAVRNEQLWIDLEEKNGRKIRVKQISGAIARRIVCWLKPEDILQKGERVGMIKLGSRTDLLLPADQVAEVLVAIGDKVQGGSKALLRLREIVQG